LEGYLFLAGGLIVGPLQDSQGPHLLIAIGTVLHVLGLMMTSISDEYYQIILAQGVCSALGMAFIFYPALTSVMTWFQEKRAAAVGLSATGAGLGGIIFPVVVIEMIDDAGFGWTMRTCAFIVLAISAIANLTARSRFPPGTREKVKPNFGGAFRDVNFILVCLSGFLTFLSLWLAFTFVVTTAIARGVDPAWAFYLVPILNAGSILGRILSGLAALRAGTITMYCVVTLYTLITITCIWIPVSGQAGMIAFAVFFGFGSGGIYTLGAASVAAVSEHDTNNLGLRTGLAFTIMGLAW
jgi:MFS transporter, MCT family, aspergillic acid transporter